MTVNELDAAKDPLADLNRPLIAALRDGYAHVDVATVGDSMEAWLEAWRMVLAESAAAPQATLGELSEGMGLGELLAHWFDDMLHVGRWLVNVEDPALFASLQALLSRFTDRFAHEPTERMIHVACTCADLLRSNGEQAGAEAAFAMIAASFPDRGQVISRWIDSRLDVADRIDVAMLQACVDMVEQALDQETVDATEHNLSWLLQSLRADQAQAQAFDGHCGARWPYFEVFCWPAPIALFRLQPDLEDAFGLRWGELLVDELEY